MSEEEESAPKQLPDKLQESASTITGLIERLDDELTKSQQFTDMHSDVSHTSFFAMLSRERRKAGQMSAAQRWRVRTCV